MSGLSKNRFASTNIIMAMVLVSLTFVTGCNTLDSGSDADRTKSSSNEISAERYTRILQQGEIVGYIGTKTATLTRGGSKTTNLLYNIYNLGFEIIGSYDESGTTYRFTNQGPQKLGNFVVEESVRQALGLEGNLELKKGLQ
ncbi:MAG: hypothetical protein AAEJ04_07390 [Planctomycetota bacterium]